MMKKMMTRYLCGSPLAIDGAPTTFTGKAFQPPFVKKLKDSFYLVFILPSCNSCTLKHIYAFMTVSAAKQRAVETSRLVPDRTVTTSAVESRDT
jgi:hypothetical protein